MCRLLAAECAGFSSEAPTECREIGEQGLADPLRHDACFIYYDGCIATCLFYQRYGEDGGVDAGDAATGFGPISTRDGGVTSLDAAPGFDAGTAFARETSASTD
jgi:hypothetical protein